MAKDLNKLADSLKGVAPSVKQQVRNLPKAEKSK